MTDTTRAPFAAANGATFLMYVGVFGVAILTTIFSSRGSFASPEAFVSGMRPRSTSAACSSRSRRPRHLLCRGGATSRAPSEPALAA